MVLAVSSAASCCGSLGLSPTESIRCRGAATSSSLDHNFGRFQVHHGRDHVFAVGSRLKSICASRSNRLVKFNARVERGGSGNESGGTDSFLLVHRYDFPPARRPDAAMISLMSGRLPGGGCENLSVGSWSPIRPTYAQCIRQWWPISSW